MKTKISLLLLAILCNFSVFAQSDFDKYFEKKSLRVDFALSGNLKSQSAAIQGLREEPVCIVKENLLHGRFPDAVFHQIVRKPSHPVRRVQIGVAGNLAVHIPAPGYHVLSA